MINSINFGKGDYLYTIDYTDGSDKKMLATNEEAANSFVIAKGAVITALRVYADIKDGFGINLNSVRFGKETDRIKAEIWESGAYPEKTIGVDARIPHPTNTNIDLPDDYVKICACIESMKGEVEKYIYGEREQPELFTEESLENKKRKKKS